MSASVPVSQTPDFKALFESIPGLYLVLSPDLKIIGASDAYLAATMTVREHILGRGIFEVFPDNPADPRADGVRNLRTSLERVLSSRKPDAMAVQKYDVRRPPSAGGEFEERYWSPVNSPVLGENGELLYIIHRVEDVTEFVHLKRERQQEQEVSEELRRHVVKVEAEIFQRAKEIQSANRRIEAANLDLAEQSDRLIHINKDLEAFTHSVAHDLKAPLRTISAYASMLEDDYGGRLDDTGKRHIRSVRDSVRHMTRMVEDLLNLAKVENHQLYRRPTPLRPLVEIVIGELERAAGRREVEWRVGSLPTVECDPGLMKQVFSNLLENSVKYSRKRDLPVIEIDLMRDRGNEIVFVRDNGVGFHMADAGKLFSVFQRLHRDDEFEGTGIGLTVVQRIISKHGGRVWAESVEGVGATFYFTIGESAPTL